jgi:hypothetical protein
VARVSGSTFISASFAGWRISPFSLAPFLVVFCIALARVLTLLANSEMSIARMVDWLWRLGFLVVRPAGNIQRNAFRQAANYIKYWMMDDFYDGGGPFQDKYPGRAQLEQPRGKHLRLPGISDGMESVTPRALERRDAVSRPLLLPGSQASVSFDILASRREEMGAAIGSSRCVSVPVWRLVRVLDCRVEIAIYRELETA